MGVGEDGGGSGSILSRILSIAGGSASSVAGAGAIGRRLTYLGEQGLFRVVLISFGGASSVASVGILTFRARGRYGINVFSRIFLFTIGESGVL